jgi:ribose transport system permease protein
VPLKPSNKPAERNGPGTLSVPLTETEVAAEAADLSRTKRPRGRGARALIERYAVVLALIALAIVFSITEPDTFPTAANLKTIANTQAVLVVIALGLTVALAAGEFDLSVGSVVGFSGAVLAFLTSTHDWAAGPALLVTLAACLGIGLLNALFVVGFRVNSLIATLGMGSFVAGIAVAIAGDTTIGDLPNAITTPAEKSVSGVQAPVFLALALVIVLWYVLEYTPMGRHLFFTGEGREAARLAGVRVARIRVVGLVCSALGAWLAGVILAGQTDGAVTTFGQPFLLPAFAAAFLGATTIKPGRYNAWGTLFSVLLLAVGTTGLQLAGAADWVTDVFNGGALVLAVTFANLASREG